MDPKRSRQNGIWDQKDPVLEGLVPKKIILVLVDEEKYPQKIVFNTQKVKKWAKTAAHMYHPT